MSEFKPCLYLPGLLNLPKVLGWGPMDMQQQRTFHRTRAIYLYMALHRTNNTGLPEDVPDFKSALLNTDIGRCRYITKKLISARYIGQPLIRLQDFFLS